MNRLLQAAAVIPARYDSSRFPGKPLAKILGKTLIQRTYENVAHAFETVVVATDDERIAEHVRGFGGNVWMTSPSCPTGTDRIVEAVKNCPDLQHCDIIVNVQGDEPCVSKKTLQAIVKLLQDDPQAVMTTAATYCKEAHSSSIVKCVIDQLGHALYFSRSRIPGCKSLENQAPYLRHIGLYGYRRPFLLHYATLKATPLQQFEDLEQLKVLEHGYRIKVAVVEENSIGVDHPEDILKVEQWLNNQHFSS